MGSMLEVFTKPVSKFVPRRRRLMQGFTLVEMMIVIVIAAIGVALAVPSFRALLEKRQLTLTAETIVTFMSTIQGAAVKTNNDITLNMRHTAHDAWCIGATDKIACDCSVIDIDDALFCDIEGIPYRIDQEEVASKGGYEIMHDMNFVAVDDITNDNITFDSVRGTLEGVNTVNIRLHTADGDDGEEDSRNYQLEVNILPTGRASICTVSGETHSDASYVKALLRPFPPCEARA